MICVWDNIKTVHSDSERIWQNKFVGVSNENPNLSMKSLSWCLNLQYQKYCLRYQFEKNVVVLK